MGRGKKYNPEQVVNLLHQIEVAVANGQDDGASLEVSDQLTFLCSSDCKAEQRTL